MNGRLIRMTTVVFTLWFISATQAHVISQWRGPNRDGIYPAQNLLRQWPEQGPEMLWSFEGLGKDQHWAHPVIQDGRLYLRHGDALMVYDISRDSHNVFTRL